MAEELTVVQPVMGEVTFSESRNELFTALAKARKAFGKVVKSSNNPFFKSKYADLAEILDATSDALSDNGLAVMQFPTTDQSGHVVIVTVLGHSSGQWAQGRLPMPVTKNDAQGVGSAITYGRRYAFGALVSVASEADDDGNAASGKTEKIAQAEDAHLSKIGQTRASAALVNAFKAMFEKSGKTEAQLLSILTTRYSAERPDQLTAEELQELAKWATSKEPLKNTLDTSLKAVKKPKDEPLPFVETRTLIPDPEAPEKPSPEKLIVRINEVMWKPHKAPRKGNYGVLEVFDELHPANLTQLFSWDDNINECLSREGVKDRRCIFEIERKPKGITLTGIVEIDGIEYKDNQAQVVG